MIYIEFLNSDILRIKTLLSLSNEESNVNFTVKHNSVYILLIANSFTIGVEIVCKTITDGATFCISADALDSILNDKADQYWLLDMLNSTIITCSKDVFYRHAVLISDYVNIADPVNEIALNCSTAFLSDISIHMSLSKLNVVRDRQNTVSIQIDSSSIKLFSTNSYVLFVSDYPVANSFAKKLTIYLNLSIKSLSSIFNADSLSYSISDRFFTIRDSNVDLRLYLVEPIEYSIDDIMSLRPDSCLDVTAEASANIVAQFGKVYEKSLDIIVLTFKDDFIDINVQSHTRHFITQVKNTKTIFLSFTLDSETFKNAVDIMKKYKSDIKIYISRDIEYAYMSFDKSYNTIIFTYKLNE